MKGLAFLVLFVILATPSFAGQLPQQTPNDQNMPEICWKNLYARNYQPTEQRQGCCSWHGGVCGCQNGRALCCDGTLSPSCGCD